MPLQIGIVGLPNVGKSTLFNALTKKGVDASNYPFCTIDPNVGVVKVPDERLVALANVSKSKEIIPTIIEFVDIAGLVKNAHKGEGLGNQFLSHIREVDAICEVVRAFPDDNVLHVDGTVDPVRDQETIHLELAMSDLTTVSKRIESVRGTAKSGNKEAAALLSLYEKIRSALNVGQWASTVALSSEEKEKLKDLHLLTMKPLLLVLNITEGQEIHTSSASRPPLSRGESDKVPSSGGVTEGRDGFSAPHDIISLDIKKEAELTDLSEEDLQELSLERTALDELIRAAYGTLGLITFFTSGPKETRAWTVTRGTRAPQAAGVIHSDFERGFIAAEVIGWKQFVELGGEMKAKELGKIRLEGKEYVIRDGDVVHFRFNV